MSAARRQIELDGPAMIAAILINQNRKKGSRAISPIECHPYREKVTNRITRGNVRSIGQAIVAIYGGK